ncbi:MAG: triose-phosphate isomerase [Spirochaetota bacterium]
MRQPFLAGNWKMHKTVSEATDLARELVTKLSGSSNKLMVAPPFTALAAVNAVLQGSRILLGAQNMASEVMGAHTGEVSVLMLRDVGVKVVILGHSERRHTYGETDELINAKVRLALEHGMEVVLCVGETLEEREADRVEEVVGTQLRGGLARVSENDLARVTIAYEPVWAIGTGKTATPEDADAVHAYIRRELASAYSPQAAERMVIQYGGSVKPGNVKELMAMENIDGALVGGASLEVDSFAPIAAFND